MFLTKNLSNLNIRFNKYIKIPETFMPFVKSLTKFNGSWLFRDTGQRVLRYIIFMMIMVEIDCSCKLKLPHIQVSNIKMLSFLAYYLINIPNWAMLVILSEW